MLTLMSEKKKEDYSRFNIFVEHVLAENRVGIFSVYYCIVDLMFKIKIIKNRTERPRAIKTGGVFPVLLSKIELNQMSSV